MWLRCSEDKGDDGDGIQLLAWRMRPVQEVAKKHAAPASYLPPRTFFIFVLLHGDAPQIFLMEFPSKASDQRSQRSSGLFIFLQDSPRKRSTGLWQIPGAWTERRRLFPCSSDTLTPPFFSAFLPPETNKTQTRLS